MATVSNQAPGSSPTATDQWRPEPSPPFAPPAPRQRRSLVGPVLLVGLGVILLLQNLGLLSWDLWAVLGRLWPLLFVLLGLEMLLGGRVRGSLLGLAIAGVALAVAGAFATGSPMFRDSARPPETRSFTQALQGATQGNVNLRFGAGRLAVETLPERAPDTLAVMDYRGPEGMRVERSYRVRNGTGELEYSLRGRDGFFPFPIPFMVPGTSRGPASQMDVRLSPDVPLTLNVQVGAAEGRIDLSGLRLSRLDLQTGASTTWLRLPEAAGQTTARVSGGAATIDIEIPPTVAAQIRYEGGASTLDLDQARFPSTASSSEIRRYRSPDYDTAANRVDLAIEIGAATVTIR